MAIGLQSPFEHEFRFAFFRGNEPNHFLAESSRNPFFVNLGDKAPFVFARCQLAKSLLCLDSLSPPRGYANCRRGSSTRILDRHQPEWLHQICQRQPLQHSADCFADDALIIFDDTAWLSQKPATPELQTVRAIGPSSAAMTPPIEISRGFLANA